MKRNPNNGIKKEILSGFIIYFIAIGLLFLILVKTVYIKSFEDLEKGEIEHDIGMVKGEINYRLNELNSDADSWAIWDDTYLFVQGLNENYIETNLGESAFDLMGVDIIMISDEYGKILYGGQKDFKTGNVVEIDKVVSENFIQSDILENKDPKTPFKDIMIIDGNPVLIGSRSILKTDGSGPGDELLKQISRRLVGIVRKNDTVCRLGGDEFVLYVNDYKDEGDLDIIASKVVDNLSKPFVLGDKECYITASVWVSQYPIDGENVEALVKNADMAMYKAKDLGKNQYQYLKRG